MNILLSILIFLGTIVLSSCRIEGDEEITLNSDGSGTIRAYYRLPEKAFSREQSQIVCSSLAALCERTEGLHAIEHKHIDAGGELFGPKFQQLRLQLAFDSKETLESIELSAAPEDQQTLEMIKTIIGHIQLSIQGLTVHINRSVDLTPLLQQISPALLGDSYFNYSIHFPTTASTSNAHWASHDGKSLHWKFLLREYYDKPMTLQAAAPIPLPKWIWWLTLIPCLFLCLFVYRFLKQRSRQSSNH